MHQILRVCRGRRGQTNIHEVLFSMSSVLHSVYDNSRTSLSLAVRHTDDNDVNYPCGFTFKCTRNAIFQHAAVVKYFHTSEEEPHPRVKHKGKQSIKPLMGHKVQSYTEGASTFKQQRFYVDWLFREHQL